MFKDPPLLVAADGVEEGEEAEGEEGREGLHMPQGL